ncbi:DUF4349 domain-containing protein [bacterium SCSIO 12643]|nr:DUF4349 domain-containing protein [bacterium SCSIO 12643]
MKYLVSLLLISVLIISCDQKKSNNTFEQAEEFMIEQDAPVAMNMAKRTAPLSEVKNQTVVKKKIIKDGRMEINVNDLESAKSNVDVLIKKYKGYYANEKLNNSNWEISYTLKIRVPGIHFENLISGIESGGGEITYKEIDARDVTAQFIDLETRLANKRNYLKKYNDLLKQAKSVKDILEIENHIRVIEEEIESTTGRLKYLNDQVAFSTLDLNIIKHKEQSQKSISLSERLGQALSGGWSGFIDFIVLIVRIWPVWILVVMFIYGLKMFRRRNK